MSDLVPINPADRAIRKDNTSLIQQKSMGKILNLRITDSGNSYFMEFIMDPERLTPEEKQNPGNALGPLAGQLLEYVRSQGIDPWGESGGRNTNTNEYTVTVTIPKSEAAKLAAFKDATAKMIESGKRMLE